MYVVVYLSFVMTLDLRIDEDSYLMYISSFCWRPKKVHNGGVIRTKSPQQKFADGKYLIIYYALVVRGNNQDMQ